MDVNSKKLKLWRLDAVKFATDVFGANLDEWQEDALRAYCDRDKYNMKVSMQAAAGVGKSYVLGIAIWHFMLTQGSEGLHPKGVCLSITWANLTSGLWNELSVLYNKSELLKHLFTITQTKIFLKQYPDTWCFYAKSFPKDANSEIQGASLAGIHAHSVFFAIDEAGAMSPHLELVANQALQETRARGGFGKLMITGNPLTKSGLLYASTQSNEWHNIRINGDPDDPKRSSRVDKEFAQQQIDRYGRKNSWVKVYILGQFPDTEINSLLSEQEVEEAMGRHLRISDYGHSQKRLGIDVARYGMDSTIIFPRQGLAAFKYTEMEKCNGNEVASRVLMAIARWKDVEGLYVDGTGSSGASVVDALSTRGQDSHEIHFSAKPTDPKFYNKRAEMFVRMAEWVRGGGALPRCNELKKELLAPTYSFKGSKLIIEDKEQIKKRLGHSCDRLDALCLTFADIDMPKKDEFEYLRKGQPNFKSEYDPFEKI